MTDDERPYFRSALLGVYIANSAHVGRETTDHDLTLLLEHDVDVRLEVYDRYVTMGHVDAAAILEEAFRLTILRADVPTEYLTRADGIIERYDAGRPR